MPLRLTVLLLAIAFCYQSTLIDGQTSPPQTTTTVEAQLTKLPPALRERGLAILNQQDEAQRVRAVASLARE
jgi:hypothetical protein